MQLATYIEELLTDVLVALCSTLGLCRCFRSGGRFGHDGVGDGVVSFTISLSISLLT